MLINSTIIFMIKETLKVHTIMANLEKYYELSGFEVFNIFNQRIIKHIVNWKKQLLRDFICYLV